ncbi:conjugal transfer protein [Brackiella oedipodis]|uniref:VirB4 family type IV secretion/conjugal transfer ATPase n=1 Tax=Brackiella oedipodis TaxID=124225 RepID=UPI00048B49E2|nr:conjugal transfer protein [Brackiella oedipodis]
MITSDFLKNILKKLANQPSHADFLPKISQHVTKNIVHLHSGYFLFTLQFEGIPFESEDDRHIETQFNNLAKTFASVGKNYSNRLALWTTLQRKQRLFERKYDFENIFCQEFAAKYLEKFNRQKFYNNYFYITVVLKYEDFKDGLKEANDLIGQLTTNLAIYSPHVLSSYQNSTGILFSEVYEFLGTLINYEYKPVPLSATDASAILGDSDLHFGSDLCEIRAQNSTKYAVCFDLKDFGVAKPKILTGILDIDCEFTHTQSFVFIKTADMNQRINRQLNNMISVGDEAIEQQEELLYGKGKLAAGDLMFGDYHSALIVYGDTPQEAANNGNMVTARFLNQGGFNFKKAQVSAPFTYFSQVPASRKKPRASPKTTDNLACTFGMHNYSQGKALGNPLGDGTAIMPLQTVSNTLFDFNFHFTSPKENNIGDKVAGHTLILGATGTGKTTLETSLIAFTNRFNPYLFVLDLDAGMKIFITALGGSYYTLSAGEPTGLNPFQLPDTPTTREFLYTLVGICGQNLQGKISADEEKQIKTAVDTLLNQVDFEHRNFSVLLQNIPYSTKEDSLRQRLARWCRSENGRFAWCLDNPVNKFDPNDFYKVGFDMTDVLKDNYPPTEPILAYMFYLRDLMMDNVAAANGILCTIVEEFWWPTRFEATQEFILKILKTDRKRGGWIVLTSQSPEDAINSPIFAAIVQQTPTKIFLPNPDAKYENSYELCGMTRKEYDELIKLSLESRTFLVKQSRQSAFAKLNLAGFSNEIAVLSGSSSNIEILNEVLQENPSASVDTWYPMFKDRLNEHKQSKRLL